MGPLSTTRPMLKITRMAISQKWLHQKKKGTSELHIFYTSLQIFDSKFKIPIATEIR